MIFFPAFIHANNIRNIVNSLFEVNILNPFPSFTSSSSPSSGGKSSNYSLLSISFSSFVIHPSWS